MEDDFLNCKIIKTWCLKATPLIIRYLIKQKRLKKDQLPSLLLDTHLKNSTINCLFRLGQTWVQFPIIYGRTPVF